MLNIWPSYSQPNFNPNQLVNRSLLYTNFTYFQEQLKVHQYISLLRGGIYQTWNKHTPGQGRFNSRIK